MQASGRMIDANGCPVEMVIRGATVKLRGVTPGGEGFVDVLQLVADGEAKGLAGQVALSSPLARGLLGAKTGERVVFDTKEGPLTLTIVEIFRT